MRNRIPTPGQEGRVLVTPENGSPSFYAKLSMADNPTEQGTPFATATMLTDATAALFGLSDEAVPDDMFRAIYGAFEDVDQTFTVTVPLSWTATSGGYTQTISVSGIYASDNPVADVVLGTDVTANDAYQDAWGSVTRIATADGSVTLYANKKAPASAFTIQLKVVR